MRTFRAALEGMGSTDLGLLAARLLDTGSAAASIGTCPDVDSIGRDRPELRRPPLGEPALLRIRVELDHATPPIWRRLDIRSDASLDAVHQVLQAAYGWAGSHLHRFSLGGSPFDVGSQLFLCPYDVQEGEDEGPPASEVRLDETIQEPGDTLRYVYDYGDSWELTLRLEQRLPCPDAAPTARCVDGRRAAPPEDSGGITDAAELAEVLADPAAFDPEEVNQALAHPLAGWGGLLEVDLTRFDPQVVQLMERLGPTFSGQELLGCITRMEDNAPQVSSAEKEVSLGAFGWFLDRAAGEGFLLTSAGYLRPADVEEAVTVVPGMGDWIHYGKNNRESNAAPLLYFREMLQSVGLLRKSKGRLLLTRKGAALRNDPEALWDYLVGRLRTPSKVPAATEATVLLCAGVASSAGEPVSFDPVTAALAELGWGVDLGPAGGFVPPSLMHLHHLCRTPLALLENVSAEPAGSELRRQFSAAACAMAYEALLAPQ